MFDFAFVDLGLNLLHHVQIFRIEPVIIQTGTKNESTTTTNAAIIGEAIFCPDFVKA